MYGWTNSTALGDDGIVWKRFLGPDPSHRYTVERDLLRSLHDRVPVPVVVAEREPWTLGTERVPGRAGVEARVVGHDLVELYRRIGVAVRTLHDLDPATIDAPLDGEGDVVLHGDVGLHNVVVGDDDGSVVLVDWERARRGQRAEDLVWAECVAAMLFPVPADAIRAMYDGYGTSFSPAERQQAVRMASDAFRRRSLADNWPPGAGWLASSTLSAHRLVELSIDRR